MNVAAFNRFAETRVAEAGGAPALQISQVFTYQSYFDSTLLAKAILAQQLTDQIVQSTKRDDTIPGHAVALHPSSQTPVAIKFLQGARRPPSQTIVLKPGQVLRPMGDAAFSGLSWGLPFGWLGGGLANLLVFQTPDADVRWAEQSEVIFHRTRIAIVDDGALPANAPYNWPMRFPWSQALQGTNSVPQYGQAALALTPTRTLMRLRLTSLASAADMRVIFQRSNDMDLDSTGAVINTPCPFLDITWGSYSSVGSGNLGSQHLLREDAGPLARLACDDGGVVFADLSSGNLLGGNYVDVVRYGRL